MVRLVIEVTEDELEDVVNSDDFCQRIAESEDVYDLLYGAEVRIICS